MTILELRGLRKAFGEHEVLKGISLEVRSGEFLTLLGPSGCGKTTTLRVVGGFEPADAGEVRLEGRDVSGLPPYRRDVHTVFQHYALFPHLDVFENVAYGLRLKGEAAVEAKVKEALALVRLEGYERRPVANLSGGQQQRIALARALAGRPKLLLLDEPLGALDLKLRREMQIELKHLQRRLGLTFIYVTHDQEEALTMSDRIAVFNEGRIEQLGAPREIYDRPATAFVADFIGAANLFDAKVLSAAGGTAEVELEGELRLRVPVPEGAEAREGQAVRIAVRPERVRLGEPANGSLRLDCALRETVYVGASQQLLLAPFKKSEKLLVAVRPNDEAAPEGGVTAAIRPEDILYLP